MPFYYQLDEEVSRTVDVGHHSTDLRVDLGTERRAVQQGPPVWYHWTVKPGCFNTSTEYYRLVWQQGWKPLTLLYSVTRDSSQATCTNLHKRIHLATSMKTRYSLTETGKQLDWSVGTFLRSTCNESLSRQIGFISTAAEPTTLWNSTCASLLHPFVWTHRQMINTPLASCNLNFILHSYQVIGNQVLERTSDGLRSKMVQVIVHHLPQVAVHSLQWRLSGFNLTGKGVREECRMQNCALLITKWLPSLPNLRIPSVHLRVYLCRLMLMVSPWSRKKTVTLASWSTGQAFTASAHPLCFTSTTLALHQRPSLHFTKMMAPGGEQLTHVQIRIRWSTNNILSDRSNNVVKSVSILLQSHNRDFPSNTVQTLKTPVSSVSPGTKWPLSLAQRLLIFLDRASISLFSAT